MRDKSPKDQSLEDKYICFQKSSQIFTGVGKIRKNISQIKTFLTLHFDPCNPLHTLYLFILFSIRYIVLGDTGFYGGGVHVHGHGDAPHPTPDAGTVHQFACEHT